MTVTPRHALVVGAGIVGLTTAYRLAKDDWRVTLVDPDPGSGATWAAAGMIAPGAEAEPGEQANYRLQSGALAAWRELSVELASHTTETLAINDLGTLYVGYDASDRRQIEQLREVASGYGVETCTVRRSHEPDYFLGVSARISEGLWIAGDGWIDPDHAVALLTRSVEALGVALVHEHVRHASVEGSSVRVDLRDGSLRGDVGVIATGAKGLPVGLTPPAKTSVRPVRGMTVRVQGFDRAKAPTLRAVVRGRSIYLVSRPGGYCVLGASSDERPELVVEVGELQRLLRDSLDIVPDLESASLVEIRQGLRPASANQAPFYEIVNERWLWSSGHYRHGVTLAPLVADENARRLAALA